MIRRIPGWRWFAAAAIATGVAVIGAPPYVGATGSSAQRLNGSWIATVTTTNPTGVPPLTILATFTEDGGLVGSAPNPHVSAAHGAWSRIGSRRFALTAVYLRFEDDGTFLGTTKLRATLELNRAANQGTATFQADQFDPSGTPGATFTGTAAATRIPVQPL